MISPPAGVMAARRVFSAILVDIIRTEPSAIATRKPFSHGLPPSFGSGFAASYSKSSGFVHDTPSWPSTIRIVLLVPSVMSAIPRPFCPGNIASLPVKTR